MWNESWPCDLLMDCLWKYFSQQVNLLLGTGVTWLWTRSWRLMSPTELIATLKCQATWDKQRVTEPQVHADIRKKTCLWNAGTMLIAARTSEEHTVTWSCPGKPTGILHSEPHKHSDNINCITLNTLNREGHLFQKTHFPSTCLVCLG